MIKQDFIGLNGFIWWVGVVETRDDPLKLGRCRVRIFGWHADNLSDLPTEQLPFAQVLLPTTGTRTSSTIREGDWVSGYFLDGENAQEPVVVGIFPGIVSELSTREDDQRVFLTRRVITKQTPPRPPGEGGTPYVSQDNTVGEPTVPRLARGIITGTAIAYSNSTRDHVCDITPEVQQALGQLKIRFGYIIQKVKEAINFIIRQFGYTPSPIVRKIIDKLKELARFLKQVNQLLAEIITIRDEILGAIRKARAIIDYIRSLPERIAAFLTECIAKFLSAIATGIAGAVTNAIPGESAFSDFAEVITAAEDLASETTTLIQNAANIGATPQAIQLAVETPASTAELLTAEATVLDFVQTTSASVESAEAEVGALINDPRANQAV